MNNNNSQKVKDLVSIKQVQNIDDLKRRVLTIGFYGAAGFAGYRFLLLPALRKMRKNQAQNTLMTDPNKRQATVLYNAMNTSGISWMRSFDQTNEEMIYDAARSITNWNAVQLTYRNLYNRDLLSDLQGELDTDEYQTFLKILSQTKSGKTNAGSQNTLAGKLIASSKDVRLRSTPDSSPGVFSFNSNILATAQSGKFLGWATGKLQVDNKGVKYLEVLIRFNDEIPSGALKKISEEQNNNTLRFWVGAGAIQQYQNSNQLINAGIKLYSGVSEVGLMGLRTGQV